MTRERQSEIQYTNSTEDPLCWCSVWGKKIKSILSYPSPQTMSIVTPNHVPATPIFNATSFIGSGTPSKSLATGILKIVRTHQDIDNLRDQGELVVVLSSEIADHDTVMKLVKMGVKGVIVTGSETAYNLAGISSPGTPVVLIQDQDDIHDLMARAEDNDKQPFEKASFSYYMGTPPHTTTQECLGWENRQSKKWDPQCLPIGGQSVWGGGDDFDVMIAVSMDGVCGFRGATPAANEAASGIVAALLAARAVAGVSGDGVGEVGFGFFQADRVGGLAGSRRFFRDLKDFVCLNSDGGKCLSPLYPDLAFTGVEVSTLLAVESVGLGSNFFVSGDSHLQDLIEAVAQNKSVSTTDDSPQSPAAAFSTYFPQGQAAVLSAGPRGGDTKNTPLDTVVDATMIADAATTIARAALAAARGGDPDTAATWAVSTIEAIESDDPVVAALIEAFTVSGSSSEIIAKNLEYQEFIGSPFQSPPNFYASVYSAASGQPYAVRGNRAYGSYTGNASKIDYIIETPSELEVGVRGLLNFYLGQSDSDHNDQCNPELCEIDGCEESLCAAGYDSNYGVMTKCVCQRARFHQALAPGVNPANDTWPGYFVVSNQEYAGFTEPNWRQVGLALFTDSDGWQWGQPAWIAATVLIVLAQIAMALKTRKALIQSKQL